MIRLAVFDTHPVQYRAPLWRELARRKNLDLTVFYLSEQGLKKSLDPGFNRSLAWDIPLLEGYKSNFISRLKNISELKTYKIHDPEKIFKESKFDCVLLLGYIHPFERQILKVAKNLGCKVIMRTEFDELRRRNFLKQWVRKIVLKRIYRQVDVFAVIGKNARNHLLLHGVNPDRMTSSPYSVDNELFEAQAKSISREAARKKLGYKKKDFVVMFSGKFIPRKQPLLLIEALGKISKSENLRLLMLGDGSMNLEVRKKVKEVLAGRGLLPGFINQSKLGGYYRAADLFVLPSDHETWGLVVNEAMQFKLPVIVSDRVGSGLDLIEAKETGEVFSSGNATMLSNYIDLFYQDATMTKRIGKNAYKRIKRYRIKDSAEGILKAVDGLENKF